MEAFTILFNDKYGLLPRSGILFQRAEDPETKSRLRIGGTGILLHRRLTDKPANDYYKAQSKLLALETHLDSIDKEASVLYGKNKKLWIPAMKCFNASIKKGPHSSFLVCPYKDDTQNLLLCLRGVAGNNTETEVYCDSSTIVKMETFENRGRNASAREALVVLDASSRNRNSVVFKIHDKIMDGSRYFEVIWNGGYLSFYERAYAKNHREVTRNNEKQLHSYNIKEMNSRDYWKEQGYYRELEKLYYQYYR
tara:strand:+ start:2800 stop:3555 length:756 start_codon:yes stop_codon:yes gene_type:complete